MPIRQLLDQTAHRHGAAVHAVPAAARRWPSTDALAAPGQPALLLSLLAHKLRRSKPQADTKESARARGGGAWPRQAPERCQALIISKPVPYRQQWSTAHRRRPLPAVPPLRRFGDEGCPAWRPTSGPLPKREWLVSGLACHLALLIAIINLGCSTRMQAEQRSASHAAAARRALAHPAHPITPAASC